MAEVNAGRQLPPGPAGSALLLTWERLLLPARAEVHHRPEKKLMIRALASSGTSK
jgi:hypothetical protein